MELKQIPTNQITANPEQPRETFEREKLRELSDSIKEIGLINPITVRKKGKQYEIVAGERRWRAHQIAKIKNVPALIKEYKQDVDAQIESLVENLQREDLTSIERENFVGAIWDTGKFDSHSQLSKKIGFKDRTAVSKIIRAKEDRAKLGVRTLNINTNSFNRTEGMEDKDRKKLFKKVEEGKINQERIKELVPIIKKASPEVKDALLDDKITVEQAENLTKISSDKAREKALKETISHKKLADITPKLAEKANPELTDALKNKMSSVQKKVFTLLYDGKVTLNKSVASLKKANFLIDGMIANPFEHALPEKLLSSMIQQMKSISDMLTQLDMEKDRFDELKETFIERIEDKL